ncbi:hypothetical protein [Bacillus cereus]|uniref:hypothetical protein n=1 Tax=Bacillus cereus TaxID=1396 RepID=UPI0009B57420|nr:hypothetical protein [Bacillus cereus]MCM3201711.1 hypothetical protein [Bacillus cereus]MDN4100248.1 hypothetical protein [Bacillus cereus]UDW03868.1 hypothetical protein FHQ13_027890 [Bacillus cereus]
MKESLKEVQTITTVSTKEELELAIKNKVSTILCTGDIAEKINRSYKMKTLSKFTLPVLAAAIAEIPFTAGMSTTAIIPVATLSGLEIAAIVAIIFLGYTLVKQIIDKYDKVSVKTNPETGGVEIVLERK